jgi:acyl-CoA reductase-like NAD-dependent aldehyde dehydrogenase
MDHILMGNSSRALDHRKFQFNVFLTYSMSPRIPVLNPATNQPITSVTSASPSDVASAITSAQEIFNAGTWSRAPVLERSKALTRLARLLEARVGDLAEVESLQTGRTIREMKVQLGRLPEWM